MTKEQAFQILASIFPTLRLNEQERESVLKAYDVIKKELGLDEKKDEKKK
ncbi:MAG: hypothetical protein K9L99_05860 [Candidatus Omnitrophica bacterium]|nr:hypothetical protein [Candidatus Omnitrophota bacterium]